jgi:hypothetical protein
MAHWAIRHILNLPKLTSISNPVLIAILPTSMPSLLLTLAHKARALCDHDTLHDEVSEGHFQA